MSIDRPWSSFVLVSDIIPRYFETHNAISAFAGHKIASSLSSKVMWSKFGMRDEIFPKKQFLLRVKVLHDKIACFSSSRLFSEQ